VNSWEGWAGAVVAALLGALIGSCVPLFWAWRTRNVERSGELTAMAAEMYHAGRAMHALKEDAVAAPLYRLPVGMLDRGLPKLVGEGLLSPNEIAALVEYRMRAGELNRGLDRAADAAVRGDASDVLRAVEQEHHRNLLKVEHLFDEQQKRLEGDTLFETAERALYRLTASVPPGTRDFPTGSCAPSRNCRARHDDRATSRTADSADASASLSLRASASARSEPSARATRSSAIDTSSCARASPRRSKLATVSSLPLMAAL
jgi:hypothetical protein